MEYIKCSDENPLPEQPICIKGDGFFETVVMPDNSILIRPKWISVKDHLPDSEIDVLISDGKNIGFGYFVAEYEAENINDPLQYRSEHWIQEGLILNTCCSGFPKVTHWMSLPSLPKDN